MKKIDFDQRGGFPLKQDTMRFMQDSYQEIILAFTDWVRRTSSFGLGGGNTGADRQILQGIEKILNDSGAEVLTPGWIIYEGGLLYFAGSTMEAVELGGGIGIAKIETPAIFKNGSSYNVYEERYAIAGGSDPIPLSVYRRISSLEDFRPIQSRSFSREVAAIAPNSYVNINIDMEGARVGDAVVVGFSESLTGDGTPVLFSPNDLVNVQGRVKANDRVILTVINPHPTLTAFQGIVNFRVKIIK